MDYSVAAFVDRADDESDHLAIDLAQSGGSSHRRPIQPGVGFKGSRIERMDGHDVVDRPGFRIHHSFPKRAKLPIPFGVVDDLDPAHEATLPPEH